MIVAVWCKVISQKVWNYLASIHHLLTTGDKFDKLDVESSGSRNNDSDTLQLTFRHRKAARLAELRANRESHKEK